MADGSEDGRQRPDADMIVREETFAEETNTGKVKVS